MKTIRFTAFSILLGLLLLASACKKETKPAVAPQTDSKIMVTGQDAAAGLKTTISGLTVNWVATTDHIGIFCAQANSNGTNAIYTATATGAKSDFTGAMTWGGAGTHTFYAYYPWVNNSVATAVNVYLGGSSQTQSGTNNNHIGALDFTVASATVSPGTAGQPVNVNLNFNHVFTLLEFDLQLAAGQSSTNLSRIQLSSTDTKLSLYSGTINLTQASPTGDNSYVIDNAVGYNTLSLWVSDCTLSSTSVTKAYLMILPSVHTPNVYYDMSIKIISDAGVTVVEKTGINFVRGKCYTVDLSGLSFSGTVSDVESHIYQTVTIGTQTWMASNLNTSKYNDGTAIPNQTDATAWGLLTTGAYCDYSNTPGNSTTYGKLYNWFAVDNNEATKAASNGGKNICPAGWHVPSYDERLTLSDYLGGDLYAGAKLKEVGTSYWETPNTGATNSTGFTAYAGGNRDNLGAFASKGLNGSWWSSTGSSNTYARYWTMSNSFSTDWVSDYYKQCGYSVRCLRDPHS